MKVGTGSFSSPAAIPDQSGLGSRPQTGLSRDMAIGSQTCPGNNKESLRPPCTPCSMQTPDAWSTPETTPATIKIERARRVLAECCLARAGKPGR